MQKDSTEKTNNSLLKLCPLIGREEVYDMDPISLEEYHEEVLFGVAACEKKVRDQAEHLLNEETIWLKKSKKLLEVMQLEIEERHAVEEFGMLLRDQQLEDEFFRKLEDFSTARERNTMHDEETANRVQNNNKIYENPIAEESDDIAENPYDGEVSPSRVSWTRLMAMRRNQSNVLVKQKGQLDHHNTESIQDFMRKTLSSTLIAPSNNSARINPFGKDNSKSHSQVNNCKTTTSSFKRKKPQTSQHKQNSFKTRSESTGRGGDRNRLIAVTILPKNNATGCSSNNNITNLRTKPATAGIVVAISASPPAVTATVAQDKGILEKQLKGMSQELRRSEVMETATQQRKELVQRNEGQVDIDGKNDQEEINQTQNNVNTLSLQKQQQQQVNYKENIVEQPDEDTQEVKERNNNFIDSSKVNQNLNQLIEIRQNNNNLSSVHKIDQVNTTLYDNGTVSDKGYSTTTAADMSNNASMNHPLMSLSVQGKHPLNKGEVSSAQSQSQICSKHTPQSIPIQTFTSTTTTTYSNSPAFFATNPTNSLQQSKQFLQEVDATTTTSTIITTATVAIPHTTTPSQSSSSSTSQFFQQLSQSFYPQSFASCSVSSTSAAVAVAASQNFSNKLRLPSLPLQYQQQLQQSLAYLQYSPIPPPIQSQSLQSSSVPSLQQKESEPNANSLEFTSFHKKNDKNTMISSYKQQQPRKSRTLLVLSSQSSTRNSNNMNSANNNTFPSKHLDKIALTIGQDSDLIDYSSHFTSFHDLFSGYYLSANVKDVNILDIMIEIYEIFREHAMKVDVNPASALSAQLSRIAIQTVNPSPAETKSPNEILRMSNRLNINLNAFIQRNNQYQHSLQRANDENQDNTDSPSGSSASSQPYYRVVKNKTEVFQIVSKSFLRQPSNWTELPHALNLKSSWNVLWTWSKPQIDFKKLLVFQKVNHFLQNKNLSRKDLLIKNLRLAMRLGPKAAKEFDIMPMTYLLPKESAAFTQQFYVEQHNIERKCDEERYKNGNYEDDEEEEEDELKTEPNQNIWIIKPTSSSQGRGIFLINDLSKVIYSEQVLAQKYLSNPLLIRGHKFDMRIYVLVTSFHPLEVFLYKEGFARLSSRLFSMETNDIEDRYIHLTNYAVQKENLTSAQQSIGGSKMSLTMLRKELEQQGIKWSLIWNQVIEIILKSLISCEGVIAANPNSFELFGYDIIVDDKRQCWLLEINASPSLNTDYLLDDLIKQQLIDDILGILQIVQFDRSRLLEVLQRRIQEQQRFQSALNVRNNSAMQLTRDLNYILHKQKIRKPGETPEKLGEFQQIAPSDAAKRIQGIVYSYKHSNNNTNNNNKMNSTSYVAAAARSNQQWHPQQSQK